MLPDQSALCTLLARWLPGATVFLAPATSGRSTPVWRVDASWQGQPSDRFYLRLGEEPGERRDGEVRAHQMLRAAGIQVPEVVAWEGMPPELDRAATLTRAIPGMPLKGIAQTTTPVTSAAIAREAGRELACMGAIPVEGFGWTGFVQPDATTGMLRAEHATRGAWLAEYERALQDVIAAGMIAPAHIATLRETFAAWRDGVSSTSITATLAHGDFDASHIFCASPDTFRAGARVPYAYTGIIDLGEARGADPLYDLGHALLHDGEDGMPAIFPALLAGYREIRPLGHDALDAIRVQAIAIGVRHLAIAHRRGSPYADALADRLGVLLGTQIGDDGRERRP